MPKIEITFERGMMRDFPLKGSETYYTKRGDLRNHYPWTLGPTYSPLRLPGYATPGYTASNIDATHATTVDTKGTAMAVQSDNNAYVIGGTTIYRLITDGTHPNYTLIYDNRVLPPTPPEWPHVIAGAVETAGDMHDIVATQQVIGINTYNVLLYSYNVAAGAGYLGRYDHTTGSNWGVGNSSDTYGALSTNTILDDNSSLSVPRPMCEGPNKILYIGSGRVIDSCDLDTAVIDLNVLDIPKDKEIQSLAFWGGKLVIAASNKRGMRGGSYADSTGKITVYFWDTFSPSYDDPITIDGDDECGALFVSGDSLYLFTSNAVYGNLRKWDGVDFVSVQQIETEIPLHGSVDELRGGLIWGDSTGLVWWFGEAVPGAGSWLWCLSKVGTNVTCVKRLASTGEKIHIAGADTGVSGFIRSFGTTFYLSEAMIPVSALPTRSTITRVEARFLPLESGASMTLSLHPNNAFDGDSALTISYASDGAVVRKVWKQRVKDVSFLSLGLAWTSSTKAVSLERIIIDYEVPKTKQ